MSSASLVDYSPMAGEMIIMCGTVYIAAHRHRTHFAYHFKALNGDSLFCTMFLLAARNATPYVGYPLQEDSWVYRKDVDQCH